MEIIEDGVVGSIASCKPWWLDYVRFFFTIAQYTRCAWLTNTSGMDIHIFQAPETV